MARVVALRCRGYIGVACRRDRELVECFSSSFASSRRCEPASPTSRSCMSPARRSAPCGSASGSAGTASTHTDGGAPGRACASMGPRAQRVRGPRGFLRGRQRGRHESGGPRALPEGTWVASRSASRHASPSEEPAAPHVTRPVECGRQEHRLKHGVVGDLGREVLKALMNKAGNAPARRSRCRARRPRTYDRIADRRGERRRRCARRSRSGHAGSVQRDERTAGAGWHRRAEPTKVLRPLIAACSTTQRSRPAPCYPRQHHGR